jgi:GT2 family glycosyltransferase
MRSLRNPITAPNTKIGIVVIGRNEGERLKRCIESLLRQTDAPIVYVDSGSTDGSSDYVRSRGVEAFDLDLSRPFNMGRARNSGFQQVLQLYPAVQYVQFMDGDCEVDQGWLADAQSTLDARPDIVAVCGTIRERFPHATLYNRLFDMECRGPAGEIAACGGPAMYRASQLQEVGGFNEGMIAGEEAELCLRLRRLGHRIWRSEHPMALHDADMHRFSQWWSRSVRTGYAYAHGFALQGRSPERHNLAKTVSCLIYGLGVPSASVGLIALGAFVPGASAAIVVGAMLPILAAIKIGGAGYSSRRHVGDSRADSALYAASLVLGKHPEAVGVLKYLRDRLGGRRRGLIEYRAVGRRQ